MIRALLVMLTGSLLASGCATYRYGTHQSMTVVTDPPGASCAFERFGKVIARVDRTPGEARVERSLFLTRLTCSLEGHHDETVELMTERAADIAARDPSQRDEVVTDVMASAAYQLGSTYVTGSAAIGASAPALGVGFTIAGPLMLAVDLVTSAWVGFRPPPVILLTRGRFDSEMERDDHFAIRRREYETQAAAMREEIANECWRARCPYELRRFDRELSAKLERLEALRIAAEVRTP
jgi:hypothetical protein